MRIYDIISHKRDGLALTDEEIAFFVKGFTDGEIKDYQMSALLMAIYLNGMDDRETVTLTKQMACSGDTLDLSGISGVTADKHSTGGVGDKTTLIVAPIVAALGIKVAKMSGRGLGHTGGTVDKLEAIDGFRVSLSPEEFLKQVKETGICVIGQTGNLAPADKKIYALRDATATVGSIPLIASSIMSKKLAAGSHCIVLDVKTGSGAFMKTPQQAEILSRKMVDIGNAAGRKTAALITDMDTPLGKNIGNALEIIEAVETLKGHGSDDLTQVCIALASNIVSLSLDMDIDKAQSAVCDCIKDGSAYNKFLEFIAAQGGDIRLIEDTERMPKAKYVYPLLCPQDGYISAMDAEKIGTASVILGAGRKTKEDSIDYSAGIILLKKTCDSVKKGEVLAQLHTNDDASIESAKELFLQALKFSSQEPQKKPLIYNIIR